MRALAPAGAGGRFVDAGLFLLPWLSLLAFLAIVLLFAGATPLPAPASAAACRTASSPQQAAAAPACARPRVP